MPVIPPPSVTPAPTSPDRSDRATFTARSIALDNWRKNNNVPESAALAANVFANATDAAASATTAAQQAAAASAAALVAGAIAWVSGNTYAIGDTRYSPANLFTYRRKTAGAGTTDPSADSTNWAVADGLPPKIGQAGKVIVTDGNTASWGLVAPATIDYPVGTIIQAPSAPDSKWLPCDGKSYLQATYPALFGVVGLRVNNDPPTFRTTSPGVVPTASVGAGPNVVIYGASTTKWTADGATWTASTGGPSVSVFLTYVNGLVLAGNASSAWRSSDNGVTFSTASHSLASALTGDIRIVNGRYFSRLGGTPWMATSSDGLNWVACTGLVETITDSFPGLGFANGVYAVGTDTTVDRHFTSTDGINWTARSPAFGGAGGSSALWQMGSVFFGSKGSSTSTIWRSTDAINWTNVTPTAAPTFPAIATANFVEPFIKDGAFYLIYNGGTLKSVDAGVTWSVIATDSGTTINRTPGQRASYVVSNKYGVFFAGRFEVTSPYASKSLTNGVLSDLQTATGTPTLNASMQFKDYGNAIAVATLGATTTTLVWRLSTPGYRATQLTAGTITGTAYWALSDSRIFVAGSTGAFISNSLYSFNPSTEFSVPQIDAASGTNQLSSYIKALP